VKAYYPLYRNILVLFTTLLLTACSSAPVVPEPETVPVDLDISTSDDINPDFENRASPIVIRIYQLTHIDTFDNNDFFTLYEKDQTVLAKDLLYREEIELTPGQKLSKKAFEINRKSKYIAVLAAYRDLDKSQWKSIITIDPVNDLKPISIKLTKFEVTIQTITKEEVPKQE